ncbi:MAG: hypothetical protein ACYTHJ_01975 [Planctomycetota bacterium]
MLRGRNKTYAIVLGVCLTALVIDRFVLSDSATTPQLVAAMPVVAGAQATPENPVGTDNRHEIPELPFPFEVNRFTKESVAVDPFQPPGIPGDGDAQGGNAGTDQAVDHGYVDPDKLDRASFEARYRLSAIMKSGQTSVVVLDDQWLRIGDWLGGCRLIEVSGREAVFECTDGQAILRFEHRSE